jgi:hypothetical protein
VIAPARKRLVKREPPCNARIGILSVRVKDLAATFMAGSFAEYASG